MSDSSNLLEYETGIDQFLYIQKLKYIVNYLKYFKSIEKLKVDSDLYEYILEEINENDAFEIVKEIINDKDLSQDKCDNDCFSNAATKLSKSRKANKPIINKMIISIDRIIEVCEKQEFESLFLNRIRELKTLFGLSCAETEIITPVYLLDNDDNFSNFFSTGHRDISKKINYVAIFLGKKYASILKNIINKSSLRKYGIIDSELDLESEITEYLNGINEKPLCNRYYTEFSLEAIPSQNFSKHDKHIKILKSIINNKKSNEGINILLYGEPGTGKTEFSRSLGTLLNKRIYEINHFDEDGDPISEEKKFTGFNVYRKTIPHDDSFLIIDEADEMLNGSGGFSFLTTTRNKEKNIVNKIIDESKHICIWISNEYKFIDESTKRRFDYSIKFGTLSKTDRKLIWKNAIEKYKLSRKFEDKDIEFLSEEYEISAGGIDIALKNCSKVAETEKISMHDAIKNILKPHQNLMLTPVKPKITSKNYSLEGVNIKGDFSLSQITDICRRFYQNGDQFSINNMNILLHGVPGTGKTEFAKYLAEELGREIIIKTGSDLLDMYVGGTEKNIRNAFLSAESDEAILFIDEVDGIFADRRGASKSWEVTQVNELLSRMENFKGIFICSTNFKDNVDTAAIRRFNLKVEFDYLDNTGKKIFFGRLLGDLTGQKLKKSEVEYLNKLEGLTPGDYKVVWQKHSFMDKPSITNMSLLKSLKEEVCSKNCVIKAIGF